MYILENSANLSLGLYISDFNMDTVPQYLWLKYQVVKKHNCSTWHYTTLCPSQRQFFYGVIFFNEITQIISESKTEQLGNTANSTSGETLWLDIQFLVL